MAAKQGNSERTAWKFYDVVFDVSEPNDYTGKSNNKLHVENECDFSTLRVKILHACANYADDWIFELCQ